MIHGKSLAPQWSHAKFLWVAGQHFSPAKKAGFLEGICMLFNIYHHLCTISTIAYRGLSNNHCSSLFCFTFQPRLRLRVYFRA